MGRFLEKVKDLLPATFLGEAKIRPERGEDDVQGGAFPATALQGGPEKPSQAIPFHGRFVIFLAHRKSEPGFTFLQSWRRCH